MNAPVATTSTVESVAARVPPVLSARGIVKTFGHGEHAHVAVDDVAFTVGRGESLGIIGESGSGKTTLARIAIGLERADSGEVLFEGRKREPSASRSKRLAHARQMQIVFQDPTTSLDPRDSLRVSLQRILALHFGLGKEAMSARVRELVEHVGLTARQADAQPRDLSGGQRQRVAIARAISVEPKVLVLDEAVSALDVSVQAQILNLLNDIRAESSMSYLFISHDLSVVRYTTDRAIVMRNGRVVEEGDSVDLMRTATHPYTRLLIASVPRPDWDLTEARALRAELEESDRADLDRRAL